MVRRRSTQSQGRSRSQSLEALLGTAAKKLGKAEPQTEASIRLQLAGPQGGVWRIEGSGKRSRLVSGLGRGSPRVEVMGNAGAVKDVLQGKRDARAAFLSGGIRVRGDISHLEEILSELGMLSES